MTVEEKPEQAEKLSEFSGVNDAVEKFKDAEANKESKSSGESKVEKDVTEEKSEETKTETLLEEEGKPEEKATGKAMKILIDDEGFFVDEDGNRKPHVIKVDGEDREIDTYEKYQTHANFGFRSDLRGEELNRREAELKQKEPIIQALLDAQKEGRLTIKDPSATATPEGEKSEGTEEFDLSELDPDVAEVLKPIFGKLKTLETDNKAMKKLLTNQFIEKAHVDLTTKIEATIGDYPLAKTTSGKPREAVWKKLAEVDEATGRALYTPEEAVKLVHEEMDADFQAHAKEKKWEHVDDKKREEIATDWWAKKEEGEKAPVSSPDSKKVGTTKPKGDKSRFTGVEDAVAQFKEDHEASVRTGARY